jgi:acylglycerol lipase
MNALDFSLRSGDGCELSGRQWSAPNSRAVVALVHGMGEHCGRYAAFAGQLVQAGFDVVSADLRGHGRSSGEPVMVERFDDYANDAYALVARAQELAAGRAVFLFGHSMGGAVGLRLLDRHPQLSATLKGAILTSSAFQVGSEIPGFIKTILGWLSKIAPRLRLTPIKPEQTSRDPVAVAAYANDPLVSHKPAPLRTVVALIEATKTFPDAARRQTLPLLCTHGELDTLTEAAGSREIHAQWSGADKTLHIWPGASHELINDLDRDAVTAEFIAWLSARCPA